LSIWSAGVIDCASTDLVAHGGEALAKNSASCCGAPISS
jgi:hypothetical protein